MPLSVKRGTNISHWLSQCKRRGDERKAFFTREDVRLIAENGFDHIRLPIDEEQMWDDQGGKETEAFDLLDSALDWALDAGLKVIVDLHILRSHHFLDAAPKLYSDPAEEARFAGLWRQLSAHLRRRPLDKVAYELMNEPVAHDAEDWNRVAAAAHAAVRESEAQRIVVLGSNRWQTCDTFPLLRVPEDRHILLSYHFYRPMLVTHYRAKWAKLDGYAGPIHYPGVLVTDADVAAQDEATREMLLKQTRQYDQSNMRRDMLPAIEVARKLGLPIYCGEFGVYGMAPDDVRRRWYRDILEVFAEYGVGWANWDYKGNFGWVDEQRRLTGIAEVVCVKRG